MCAYRMLPHRLLNRTMKHSRTDPDEDYDVFEHHERHDAAPSKAGRSHRGSGPVIRTSVLDKTTGASWYQLSPTYTHARDLKTTMIDFAYSRAAEAFDILLREYTKTAGLTGGVTIGYTAGHRPFQPEACEELLNMLHEDAFVLVAREYSPPLRESPLFDQSLWHGEHGTIFINTQSGRDVGDNITIASPDTALIARYLDWWERGKIVETSQAKISGIFSSPTGGMEMREFNAPIGWPIERENYTREVLGFYDMISAELVSPTPGGRLAILEGKPGCGKTYLLRGLVQDLSDRAHFIYLPASMVSNLDGPQMLSILNEDTRYGEPNQPNRKVFVIEDADECLVSRGPDNMSAIRNLLNFCDGFLGTMLDIRIVATTNSGHIGRTDKVDSALLRPGRLIGRATVQPLASDELKRWFEQHVETMPDTIPNQMTLAEAYAMARTLGWKPKA